VSIAQQGFTTTSLFDQAFCTQDGVVSNTLYIVTCSNTSLGNILTQVK